MKNRWTYCLANSLSNLLVVGSSRDVLEVFKAPSSNTAKTTKLFIDCSLLDCHF